MKLDITDGHGLFESSVSCSVLATVALALRFVAKGRLGKGLTWDDYWLVLSLGIFWSYNGVLLYGIFVAGGGLDMPNILSFNILSIELCLKLIFINMSLYTASVTAAKISILLFYRRIFWVHESFVRATTIIGVISVCWFIVVEATIFSTCQPINAAWDLGINAKCIDFMTFFLGMAIVELLIDVCILCLPIWHVLNLKLELKYKIGVLFIFLLGGFVCITSILRIQKVYVPGERQLSHTRGLIWTTIHLGVAIICTCLPTYRPLVSKWRLSSFKSYRKNHLKLSSGSSRKDAALDAWSLDRNSPISACESVYMGSRYSEMDDFVITFSSNERLAGVR